MKRNLAAKTILVLLLAFWIACSLVNAKSVYPMDNSVTLTYWCELATNAALVAKNLGDTEFAKQLQERTGIKVKFLHPPAGQAREAFNLMLASGDLPDIIEYNWFTISGGPNAAISNNVIQKLNPILDKYGPNLKTYLQKNPQYDKMVRTDEGNYYVFPFIRGDLGLLVTSGPMLRKDWLTELKLKAPTTYDEWYTVLKAFKEKKNASAPLTIEYGQLSYTFAGGADNCGSFYVDKGVVKYGGIEPNRKTFLATMRKWYDEGLLDKNFATTNRKMVDANILSGKSGATYGFGGSSLGRYLEANRKDPSFDLMGVQYPAPKKGGIPRFGFISPAYGPNMGSSAITTKCKNVEAAARFLDYAYSKEGHMLYNFGVENVSYKMIDGKPVYTDLIMKNPEKLSNTQVMSKYMRSHYNGPFIQDKRYLEQYYEWQQQRDAVVQWKKQDYAKYMMPPVTPTLQESQELAKIMNDINTYTEEMTLKFITGMDSLDKFDQYVAQIKKMGIDRAIAIYQAALDRYNKRIQK